MKKILLISSILLSIFSLSACTYQKVEADDSIDKLIFQLEDNVKTKSNYVSELTLLENERKDIISLINETNEEDNEGLDELIQRLEEINIEIDDMKNLLKTVDRAIVDLVEIIAARDIDNPKLIRLLASIVEDLIGDGNSLNQSIKDILDKIQDITNKQ